MKRKLVSLLIFYLFIISVLHAQNDPPALHCITVNADGSTELRWSAPFSTTGFQKYKIFYNLEDVGQFELLTEIANALQSTYTHIDADANSSPLRYYMIAEYELTNSHSSDTLSSMFLEVNNSNLTLGQLSWNAPRTPLHASSSDTYNIYRALSDGIWTLRGTTTETSFIDPVDVCNDSVNYRIELPNDFECQSVSSATGRRFRDIVYPDKPVLDSVSVVGNGQAQLGWTVSQATDTYGYIIYRFENSTWQGIDTVYDRTFSSYVDQDVNTCLVSPQYAIAAFDSCLNKSPGTFLTPQRTILPQAIDYNSCSLTNQLSWTAYENAVPVVEKYRILLSDNAMDFIVLDEVDGSSLSYLHQNLVVGITYHYKIQAVFGDASSTSCMVSSEAVDYQRPDFLNLLYVTVQEDGDAEIFVEPDLTATINTLETRRSTTLPQQPAMVKNWSPPFQSPATFLDEEAATSDSSYYYSISLNDSCGFRLLESGTHRTILLSGAGISSNENSLSWNAYEGFSIGEYRVFRRLTGQDEFTLLATLPASSLIYNDIIQDISSGDGQFSYVIEAVASEAEWEGEALRSRSNLFTITVESGLFMPNAFRPGGTNSNFGPVYRFAGYRDYSLLIFSRWGKIVFESRDINQAWDGRFAGEWVPAGAYAYLLSYRNQYDQLIQKRGTVSVVY
ncbi:MAG: gliding motility-associated C-terminal domain-containing protein [Bacteroidales bacterium]|nr:gliding motility-associated C-terminal domain-containing protein [Bacteroidales bacterium]